MPTAIFMKSAARPTDFPPDEGREVAFVGRSNSGKSTAVNLVTGTHKLARVSKTPGRTQHLNFFRSAKAGASSTCRARVSSRAPDDRRFGGGSLEAYLRERRVARWARSDDGHSPRRDDARRHLLRWLGPRSCRGGAVDEGRQAEPQRGRQARAQARRRARPCGQADAIFGPHGRRGRDGASVARDWLGPPNKKAPGAGFRGRTRGIDPGGVGRDLQTPH